MDEAAVAQLTMKTVGGAALLDHQNCPLFPNRVLRIEEVCVAAIPWSTGNLWLLQPGHPPHNARLCQFARCLPIGPQRKTE